MVRDMEDLEKFWEQTGEKSAKIYIDDLSGISYIPFIGSGMSVPFGFPDWSNFLSKVIDNFLESSEKQAYIDLLEKGNFLELADMLNDSLGNGVVEEQVKNEFGFVEIDKINKDNYLSVLKRASIKTFITTNFDSVIETYMGLSADKIYLPSNLLHSGNIIDNIRLGKGCVIKLHGTANQPESIILTGKTFNEMYKCQNTSLTDVIDYLWNKTVFLFLGCGLKNDYLIEHLRTLANTTKTNWHYAVLPYPNESDIIKRRRELAGLKIRPIWFEKGKYEQIYTILSYITGNDNTHQSTGSNAKEERQQVDTESKNSSSHQDDRILSESASGTLNINHGNIGTQNIVNVKYLNGNISL